MQQGRAVQKEERKGHGIATNKQSKSTHKVQRARKKTYNAVGGNGLELELGLSDGEVLAEEVVGGLADVSEGNGDGGESHCTRSIIKADKCEKSWTLSLPLPLCFLRFVVASFLVRALVTPCCCWTRKRKQKRRTIRK